MMARHQKGFTLIEVAVAFAIFALSAGVLYEAFSGAMERSVRVGERELALLKAQSLLAQLRVSAPPWSRQSAGKSDDGWAWQLRVDPFNAGTDIHHPWKAFEVTVYVARDGAANRAITLKSVELARSTP